MSATQTLGNAFGSRLMPEGTGIWLNHSLAYCTFEPKGNPMDAHAGRRKLSGDCPTIILKAGRVWAALGKEVFCYFDNDEAGFAAHNALTLQEMLK